MERKFKKADYVRKTCIQSFTVKKEFEDGKDYTDEQKLEVLTRKANQYADENQLEIQSFQVIALNGVATSMVVHYVDLD